MTDALVYKNTKKKWLKYTLQIVEFYGTNLYVNKAATKKKKRGSYTGRGRGQGQDLNEARYYGC